MRLLQHVLCLLLHGRVSRFAAAEREDVPPFSQVRLHNDAACGRIGQYFARLLRGHSFSYHFLIGDFCVFHGLHPHHHASGIGGWFTPGREDKGDVPCSRLLDISLGFNTERRLSVTGLLSHDGAGCGDFKRQIAKLQRHTMSFSDQGGHEIAVAVLRHSVLAGITIPARNLTVTGELLPVQLVCVQLSRALLTDNHRQKPPSHSSCLLQYLQ